MLRILSTLVLLAIFYSWQPAVAKPMSITATSWLVADESGRVLQGKNIEEQRSIASITKLMTVMVVLDQQQPLDEKIGNTTRQELIQLTLIKSDNNAAMKLCENYPTGKLGCIHAMNDKAAMLGLTSTHYIEPTGLSVMNVSTAQELVTIVRVASTYPEIVQASNTHQAKVKKKKSWYVFHNTNPLVATHDFIISKTGYIRASGGCIVMMLDTKIGRRIVVLLNSKNVKTRIPEADYIAQNF
jgi:D-alanyl-D-alanine endopeptidase (penicillin-binding protein 7)